MSTEFPPDWAIEKAQQLFMANDHAWEMNARPASEIREGRHAPGYAKTIEFARYIAEHEEAPADPLLPCPFCGGAASDAGHIKFTTPLINTAWLDGSAVLEAFYVNCTSCGAVSRSGLVGGYQTKSEAIAAWNRRA